MTTAVAEHAEHAAHAALDETYARVPIDQIRPSKTNPRTHFDPEYLNELAGSIREKGVLEPILLRPFKKGQAFEIVAGECRYRASVLAELTHLPAVIREYSDEQVLEIQIEENTHRKDLTPLEEAAAYRRLITVNPDKHTAASIATRVGMSVTYVWDYLSLLNLVPEAKTILERKLMSVGHAVLIARLKPEDQQRAIDVEEGENARYGQLAGLWTSSHSRIDFDDEAAEKKHKPGKYDGVKAVSVRELDAWIRDHIRFDVAHAAKAQPLAFEAVAAKVEEAAAVPGRGKNVISITHEYRVADDARDPSERTYGSQSWERADGKDKSKTCEYSVLGVVATGEKYGETLQVCVNRDKCKVHFGDVIRQREKNQKLRDSGKPKQAAKNEKKQEATWERDNRLREEARKRWELLKPHALAAAAAKVKPGKITDAVLAGVVDDLMSDDGTEELRKLLGGRVTAKTFTRALAIVKILDNDWSRERFAPIAKKYGVDLKKLEADLAKKDAAAPAKKAS